MGFLHRKGESPKRGILATEILVHAILRTRSTTTRDTNLHFRGAVSTGFFIFPIDFFVFLQAGVNVEKQQEWKN